MPHTFGNQGGLFLQAMVWWDHETESFWSQPTGLGIVGEYAGVRLEERQSWTRLNPSRCGEGFESGTTALFAGVSTAFT